MFLLTFVCLYETPRRESTSPCSPSFASVDHSGQEDVDSAGHLSACPVEHHSPFWTLEILPPGYSPSKPVKEKSVSKKTFPLQNSNYLSNKPTDHYLPGFSGDFSLF